VEAVTSVALLCVPICILLWGHVTWSDYQHTYFSTQSCTFAKTQWFSTGAVQRKPDTYLNRMLLPIDFTCVQYRHTTMDACQLAARPFCPVSSAPRWTHAWVTYTVMTLLHAQRMHALQWPCSVVGRRNVMTLTSWSHRNVIMTSYGSV
jgi:hypothetical protein